MNVYVVENGESSEGGRVIGVFDNRDAAVTCALRCERVFPEPWE